MEKFLWKDYKNKRRVIITSLDEKENFELLIPRSKYLNVQEGDFVKKGDILVEGLLFLMIY